MRGTRGATAGPGAPRARGLRAACRHLNRERRELAEPAFGGGGSGPRRPSSSDIWGPCPAGGQGRGASCCVDVRLGLPVHRAGAEDKEPGQPRASPEPTASSQWGTLSQGSLFGAELGSEPRSPDGSPAPCPGRCSPCAGVCTGSEQRPADGLLCWREPAGLERGARRWWRARALEGRGATHAEGGSRASVRNEKPPTKQRKKPRKAGGGERPPRPLAGSPRCPPAASRSLAPGAPSWTPLDTLTPLILIKGGRDPGRQGDRRRVGKAVAVGPQDRRDIMVQEPPGWVPWSQGARRQSAVGRT